MLLCLILALEIIPNYIPYVDKTNYVVIVTDENCPPCRILEREWVESKKLNNMFTSVLVIKNEQKRVFNGLIVEKQKVTPTTLIYKWDGARMNLIGKNVGYVKDSFSGFVERYKNEKDELEEITELPSLTKGIFGK